MPGEQHPTPPPSATPHGVVPSISATTQAVKRYLVLRPDLDALTTARASLLPLLYATGNDIWSPQVLWSEGLPSSKQIRYQLQLTGGQSVTIDIWAVGEALDHAPARNTMPLSEVWGVRSNGRDWQLVDFTSELPKVISFGLFDETFPTLFSRLFSARSEASVKERLRSASMLSGTAQLTDKLEQLIAKLGAEAVRQAAEGDPQRVVELLRQEKLLEEQETPTLSAAEVQDALGYHLNATQLGFVRAAPPLSAITIADVERHCQVVKHLKGQLEANFDGTPVEITSRSGFYYVLAALAVQYGRQDVIPAEDLIAPPDNPPEEKRYRPLGKPGWYLALTGSHAQLEHAVNELLDALNLRHRFEASQRGHPFPSPPPVGPARARPKE